MKNHLLNRAISLSMATVMTLGATGNALADNKPYIAKNISASHASNRHIYNLSYHAFNPTTAKTDDVLISSSQLFSNAASKYKHISLLKGESQRLKIKGLKKNVKWKSSNPSVVKIEESGKITAKNIGKATISVKSGKKTYKYTVSVNLDIAPSQSKVNIKSDKPSSIAIRLRSPKASVTSQVSDDKVVSCVIVNGDNPSQKRLKINPLQNGTATIKLTVSGSKEAVYITVRVSGLKVKEVPSNPSNPPAPPKTDGTDTPSNPSGSGNSSPTQSPSESSAYKDGTYTGSASGFGGNVSVTVKVLGGKIISVDAYGPNETSSYWSEAQAVTSRIISAQSPNVDVVTGATYSSNGIINAAKAALSSSGTKGTNSSASSTPSNSGSIFVPIHPLIPVIPPQSGSSSSTPSSSKPNSYKDGTYTGSASGFGGDVSVTVKVSDGKIISVDAYGPNETASYWSEAQAVTSRIISAQSPNVDVVTGATYSSNGIIHAAKAALSSAVKKDADNSSKPSTPAAPPQSGGTNTNPDKSDFFPLQTKEALDNLDKNTDYQDGTYYGEAEGRRASSPIKVAITVDGGKITSIKKRNASDIIDDGDFFEKQGFDNVIEEIIENQNPNNMRQQINDLFELCNRVSQDVSAGGNTKSSLEQSLKRHISDADISQVPENIPLEQNRQFGVISKTIKPNLKNNGYDKVDVVSGATFTGRGTVNAVCDALSKAKDGVTLKDFDVISDGFKTSYVDGEKLELAPVKIKVEYTDGTEKTLDYADFKANGFKVVKRNTNEEISDSEIIGSNNAGTSGLNLSVLYAQTGSSKNLPTITSRPVQKYLTPKAIVVREKGSSQWYTAEGFSSDDPVNQKLTIPADTKNQLLGKDVEFGLVCSYEGHDDATILIRPSTPYTDMKISDNEKTYYTSIWSEDIADMAPGYTLADRSLNITITGTGNSASEPEKPDTESKPDVKNSEWTVSSVSIHDEESDEGFYLSGNLQEIVNDIYPELTFDDDELEDVRENLFGKNLVVDVTYTSKEGDEKTITLTPEDGEEVIVFDDEEGAGYSGQEISVSGSAKDDDSNIGNSVAFTIAGLAVPSETD